MDGFWWGVGVTLGVELLALVVFCVVCVVFDPDNADVCEPWDAPDPGPGDWPPAA